MQTDDDSTLIITVPEVGERRFALPSYLYEAAALGILDLPQDGGREWGVVMGAALAGALWADDGEPPKRGDAGWLEYGRTMWAWLVDADGWPQLAVARLSTVLSEQVYQRLGLDKALEEEVTARVGFGASREASETSSE